MFIGVNSHVELFSFIFIYFDASGSVVELLFSLGDASVGSRDFDGSKGRQRNFYL